MDIDRNAAPYRRDLSRLHTTGSTTTTSGTTTSGTTTITPMAPCTRWRRDKSRLYDGGPLYRRDLSRLHTTTGGITITIITANGTIHTWRRDKSRLYNTTHAQQLLL